MSSARDDNRISAGSHSQSVIFPASGYKRQKVIVAPPNFPLSDHDSDNEPPHPFHVPPATHLSPKRQRFKAEVRRLKRNQQRSEQLEEATVSEQDDRLAETSQRAQAGKTRERKPTSTTSAAQGSARHQSPLSAQDQLAEKKGSERAKSNQLRASADGGRDTAGLRIPAQPTSSSHHSPPAAATRPARRTRSPIRTVASAPSFARSRSRHSSPLILSELSCDSSLAPLSPTSPQSPTPFASSSSASSPLSPQQLLQDWVDRRISVKRRTEQKEEQQWRSAIQQQLQQIVEQNVQLQRASGSAQQKRDREERVREARIERLEDRMERMITAFEQQAQQQRRDQADRKRRRVLQRALQMSGSGGKSEARRALTFPRTDERKTRVTAEAPRIKTEQNAAAEPPGNDDMIGNESQLVWVLQNSDKLR